MPTAGGGAVAVEVGAADASLYDTGAGGPIGIPEGTIYFGERLVRRLGLNTEVKGTGRVTRVALLPTGKEPGEAIPLYGAPLDLFQRDLEAARGALKARGEEDFIDDRACNIEVSGIRSPNLG
jgi:hypothetical protein